MILREKDVGGQERVTTDEEPVLQGLNSDQAVQISRLSSGKGFVSKRKKFYVFARRARHSRVVVASNRSRIV